MRFATSVRFTPADAGKILLVGVTIPSTGSPPLMRVKDMVIPPPRPFLGFTPAYAGKS